MREIPILMPKMSMTMTEGTLVVWHRQPGDQIRSGDTVCDVATDKVDMEVEAPADGTLARLVAEPDEVVPVGQPIAYLATTADDLLGDLLDGPDDTGPDHAGPDHASPDHASPDHASPDHASPDHASPDHASADQAEPVQAGSNPDQAGSDQAAAPMRRPPAVPLARLRAAQVGIDLARVRGTGPYGTIRLADLAGLADPPAGPSRRREPHRPARQVSLRSAIARRMTESTRIPQFTLHADIRVREPRDPWTARLVAAWAEVLRAAPALRARWHDGGIAPGDSVGVAVAVTTAAGLVAPVVHDPDLMPLAHLAADIDRLSAQARAGRLAVANLSGATTTVLCLDGTADAMVVSPAQVLLAPPQATMLAVGSVGPQAVVSAGAIEVQTRCRTAVTVDHRLADPPDAVHALARLQEVLDGQPVGTGSR